LKKNEIEKKLIPDNKIKKDSHSLQDKFRDEIRPDNKKKNAAVKENMAKISKRITHAQAVSAENKTQIPPL